MSQLEEVLRQRVVKQSNSTIQENLCADAGYFGISPAKIILSAGYEAHVRGRGEEKQAKLRNPSFKARRWVVESCHSWLNRFRKLTICYEKRSTTHLALLHLAATIVALRKIGIIYG